jgi:hypothetical protein
MKEKQKHLPCGVLILDYSVSFSMGFDTAYSIPKHFVIMRIGSLELVTRPRTLPAPVLPQVEQVLPVQTLSG